MPRIVAVKLPDDVYRELEKRAREEGFVLVSDYVKEIIMRELGKGGVSLRGVEERLSRLEEGVLPTKLYERIVEIVRSAFAELLQSGSEPTSIDEAKIMSRIERRVQDLVNPFTAKVDALASRIANLVEKLEDVEERLSRLEEEVKELRKAAKEHAERGYPRRHRMSAIERLKKEGVVFESELGWLRNKTAFFDRLRREGAKVIEAGGERIAVDPEFWQAFVEKLSSIKTSSVDEIKTMLNDKEFRLFMRLREDGLIYFDSTTGAWRLLKEF
ncbi:MAG: hypothetical protein GXO09_06625 [Crenarchaeota archaeon]|nr:hypothetical protein [Thermoproteota archaeon]